MHRVAKGYDPGNSSSAGSREQSDRIAQLLREQRTAEDDRDRYLRAVAELRHTLAFALANSNLYAKPSLVEDQIWKTLELVDNEILRNSETYSLGPYLFRE